MHDRIYVNPETVIAAGEYHLWSPYNTLLQSDGDSLDKLKESAAVEWIVSTESGQRLFQRLGFSPSCYVATEVKEPVIENSNQKPGDIDLLVFDRPDEATAVQVKCVKVESYTQAEDWNVKKLPDIRDVTEQVNRQCARMKFNRNYMMIVVLTSSVVRTEAHLDKGIVNLLLSGATAGSYQQIYDVQQKLSLDENAGVIYLEIIQPTARSFRHQAVILTCVARNAQSLAQPVELTNRIRAYQALRSN